MGSGDRRPRAPAGGHPALSPHLRSSACSCVKLGKYWNPLNLCVQLYPPQELSVGITTNMHETRSVYSIHKYSGTSVLKLNLSWKAVREAVFLKSRLIFPPLEILYQHKKLVRSRTEICSATETFFPWTTWWRSKSFKNRGVTVSSSPSSPHCLKARLCYFSVCEASEHSVFTVAHAIKPAGR